MSVLVLAVSREGCVFHADSMWMPTRRRWSVSCNTS